MHPLVTASGRRHGRSLPRRWNHLRFRPFLDSLEARALLAQFTVSTTADSGPGSLRDAIQRANANTADHDTIDFVFALGAGDPGYSLLETADGSTQDLWTIRPATPLPTIVGPVDIVGTPAPPDPKATAPPIPRVELDGSLVGDDGNGLDFQGVVSGSSVRGLTINRFRNGIRVLGPDASGVAIAGCLVGLTPDGLEPRANTRFGIAIVDASGNTIGGTRAIDRNVISGNAQNGVLIQTNDVSTGVVARGNVIAGNYVGINVLGLAPVPNARDGVGIFDGIDTLVGLPVAGGGNVLSGNQQSGVQIAGPAATGNLVRNNLIGTKPDGRITAQVEKLFNSLDGVTINGASGNRIGGPGDLERNVIAANTQAGVAIRNLLDEQGNLAAEATGNVVAGNFIGVDIRGGTPDGQGPAPDPNLTGNVAFGVLITQGVHGNRVGGSDPRERNVIGGSASGVQIDNAGNLPGAAVTRDNVVDGNFIGTDQTGALAYPNVFGVYLQDTQGNTIGGAGNLIAGNRANGVVLESTSAGPAGPQGNRLIGNLVGTDVSGGSALPNRGTGIFINGAPGNLIGNGTAAGMNTIAGNLSVGVQVVGASAVGNRIDTNRIGTDARGLTAVPNNRGAQITDAPLTVVRGNLISGNRGSGVSVDGTATAGQAARILHAVIVGNLIGLNADGADAMPNLGEGIAINGVAGNQIGGSTPGSGNIVSGNSSFGILLFGAGAWGNVVQGNDVGTDARGGAGPGNAAGGILVSAAPGNLIGGSEPGAGNVIAGNGAAGAQIQGPTASGNVLLGNRIGTDRAGAIALANRGAGVLVVNAPGNVLGAGLIAPGMGPNGPANVVSGNVGPGFDLLGEGAVGNVVAGNLIGTSANGAGDLGNRVDGIRIAGLSSTGAATRVVGNLIAANSEDGIRIVGASGREPVVLVVANTIGAELDGRTPRGNGRDGVRVEDAHAVTVLANTLSANAGAGVSFLSVIPESGGGERPVGAGNVVQANQIGASRDGALAIGNGVGVTIQGMSGVLIGGQATLGQGNVISGNRGAGVLVAGSSTGNAIQGNVIGADRDGQVALPNAEGIILQRAGHNLIGGRTDLGQGNLVAGNATTGIRVTEGFRAGVTIVGNAVGTYRASGIPSAQPRQPIGVLIERTVAVALGSADPRMGNVLAGNQIGVEFAGYEPTLDPSTSAGSGVVASTVQGNLIGLLADGGLPAANARNDVGLFLNNVPAVDVGSTLAGSGNTISGNTQVGLQILGPRAWGHAILGNVIGLDRSGKTAAVIRDPATGRALPAQHTGVFIQDAGSNTLGALGAGASNVISGNVVAVYILGTQGSARQNTIAGNLIGPSRAGGPPPGNTEYGVLLFNAPDNPVSQSGPSRNRFAANGIANVREFTGRVTN